MTKALTAIGLLAAEEDIGKAGPVGLFLIVSLLIVVFFLGRSMRTHLRRVPLEFPDQTKPQPDGPESRILDDGVIEGEILDPPSNRRPGEGEGPQRTGSTGPNSV